ncbi:hypothetical protein FQA39_LY07840 [Lamprigera yunnana]|nr:hypothetical protein FQA39_LY07840 [Lamprigera yunnana]
MLKTFLNNRISYNLYFKRLAGHSKWANIRHTKALKDSERGKLFTKLGQQIKVAIQEGGSTNPAANLRLEQIIAQARRSNMPNATIESVIQSTQRDKTKLKNYVFEIKGPANATILCEVCTANLVKTKNEITTVLKKNFSRHSDSGGRHLFKHKGVIEVKVLEAECGKSETEILERATNDAIECEAEDVHIVENNLLEFTSDVNNFMQVQKNLEKLGYQITQAQIQYIPITLIQLSEKELEVCHKLFDRLTNMEDVVALHDNIA